MHMIHRLISRFSSCDLRDGVINLDIFWVQKSVSNTSMSWWWPNADVASAAATGRLLVEGVWYRMKLTKDIEKFPTCQRHLASKDKNNSTQQRVNLVDCEACFLLDVYLTYGTNGRSGWATILLSRSLQIAINDLWAIHAGLVGVEFAACWCCSGSLLLQDFHL